MADRLDTWKSIREDIVLDHPEYELALEEFRNGPHQMVFIHLWVRKDWSKKLLKRFLYEWRVLRKHVTCPLYAAADTQDHKWEHFISLFGFKPLTVAIWNGEPRRIYWHQNNDQFNTKTTVNDQREHELQLDDGPGNISTTVP